MDTRSIERADSVHSDVASVADKRKLARRALRHFRSTGDKAADTPTPERLVQAGGTARVEKFAEAVEVVRRGRAETKTIDRHRIRVEDAPLDRLRSRQLLYPGDRQLNGIMHAAGTRYRELWMLAGLSTLRAADLSREPVSGAGGGLFSSERQATAFAQYCMASDKMAVDPRRVVDAVVLREREPTDIGREVSGYKDDKQARAVAMYLLHGGLTVLMVHFGLMSA